jgi:hypothetical protein
MPGIADPDEVDVVAEDVDGAALLSIVQRGPWSAQGTERPALKRKLGTYLRYALEGQMVSMYPTLQGRPVVIELQYEQEPPPAILDYWRRRGQATVRDGVTLRTRALGEVLWRA